MRPLIPPPVVAAVAAGAQQALSQPPSAHGPVRATLAALLSLASVGLAGAAIGGFRRSGTTVEPLHPEQTTVLVTAGPHALTRNPMYVGLAGLLVAHAVHRGSWRALLPVAGFVAVIDRIQVQAEEAALEAKFGAEYDAYRSATPRWLGIP